MAANATAVWRVRPSGNNNNGGGFDCSISAGATGTNGSFTGTTFTDATAAAFTSGMVGSSINITGIGQYKITARIDASNITLGSGNPGVVLTGGQAWTVGSGQDYSQQNAAQLSNIGTVSTATVTLTDTGASFTTAVIGNGIWVSGTGITTTFTYITARPSATTLTLQTSPGTTGSAVSYNIGGGWADFWTNGPKIVAGNTVYVLGSQTPNPASYTYDYDATAGFTVPGGTNFAVVFANDPATPGYKSPPDTTGGMPVIKFHVAGTIFTMTASSFISLRGLWFVGTTTAAGKFIFTSNTYVTNIEGCVLDQFSFDVGLCTVLSSAGKMVAIGCEVFSSVAPGGAGTLAAFTAGVSTDGAILSISGCNIHDCVGIGIIMNQAGTFCSLVLVNSIIAKGSSDAVQIPSFGYYLIQNCTIDGNAGNGVTITNTRQNFITMFNNIFSNQTGVGKFAISANAAVTGLMLMDYNVYYNNTADLSNLSYGPHDTHGGSNPYVGSATENFTLV